MPKDFCTARPSTDEEKQQLFSALEKEGKAWDSEHKMIVDLPKNCEFKPFDKVICRDSDADIWKASFFSHYDERAYYPFFVTIVVINIVSLIMMKLQS